MPIIIRTYPRHVSSVRVVSCKNKGFSLVELSIVLVILGLLVGGVLAGKNLIRAAELRTIQQDVEKYQIAMHAFRDRYRALPGDMRNAVRFWGAQAGGLADGVDAECVSLVTSGRAAMGAETCNGNGDGRITGIQWHEVWRVWQHLANAGMVAGHFSAIAAAPDCHTCGLAGVNMPASRATQGGFAFLHNHDRPVDEGGFFAGNYGNILRFGAGEGVDESPGTLLPDEAWLVDRKMDDGKPGTGVVRSYMNTIRSNCVTAGSSDVAEYRLQHMYKGCNLLFVLGF